MRLLWVLFGLGGRIDRADFAGSVLTVVALFWLCIQISIAALPLMADLLAPHGINGGFALNGIWLAIGLALVWSLIAIGTKRLRDRGRSPWWIVVVVVPLAALALLNDTIFLLSKRLFVPPQIQWAILIDSGLIGLWVLVECLFGPSRIMMVPHVEAKPKESLGQRLSRVAASSVTAVGAKKSGASNTTSEPALSARGKADTSVPRIARAAPPQAARTPPAPPPTPLSQAQKSGGPSSPPPPPAAGRITPPSSAPPPARPKEQGSGRTPGIIHDDAPPEKA